MAALCHPAQLLGPLRLPLRAAGYDGVLSIEHEDALVNPGEGVQRAAALLHQIALRARADWNAPAI